MNEERRMILQMLRDGAISVEEAERLMEAIPAESTDKALAVSTTGINPRRILVTVTENGKTKVNIKVPFSLVKAGLKMGQSFGALGAKYAKDSTEAAALDTLRELDIDEILASISEGDITLPYVMVDVEDEDNGQHVQVVLE